MQRRQILTALAGGVSLGLAGCATGGGSAGRARVLVVGGGYGGATVSKYIRLLSEQQIDVMMVEPNREFVSCPVSNLVLAGMKNMADITTSYSGLSGRHGVRVVHDRVLSVDAAKKTAQLESGGAVAWENWCWRRASTSCGTRPRA